MGSNIGQIFIAGSCDESFWMKCIHANGCKGVQLRKNLFYPKKMKPSGTAIFMSAFFKIFRIRYFKFEMFLCWHVGFGFRIFTHVREV